ncbi:Fatty-acyl-CoA synthase system [Ascochyta lentis]
MTSLSHATTAEKTRVVAVFGGQGDGNLTSLQQIKNLYPHSAGAIDALIERATRTLQRLIHQSGSHSFHDTADLNLKAWIHNEQASPEPEVLAGALFSVPINTVLAFAQLVIVCKSYGLTPGEFAASLCSVSGRSEGMLVALALAQTTDWASFFSLADAYVELSFWIGLSAHEARPPPAVTSGQVQQCLDMAESKPSHMLRINGLPRSTLESALCLENNTTPGHERDRIYLASLDSYRQVVLSGLTDALIRVCARLHKERPPLAAGHGGLHFHFLPVSTPLHTPIVAAVLERLRYLASTMPILNRELQVPIVSPQNGRVMQDSHLTVADVVYNVVESMLIKPMDWPAACESLRAGRILAFGPFQTAAWLREAALGVGLDVMDMADDAVLHRLKHDQQIFHLDPPQLSWRDAYRPRILCNLAGDYSLCTKMTERFNVLLLIVGGITPTTVAWDVVAAIANAGYYVELAASGYHKAVAFEVAV